VWRQETVRATLLLMRETPETSMSGASASRVCLASQNEHCVRSAVDSKDGSISQLGLGGGYNVAAINSVRTFVNTEEFKKTQREKKATLQQPFYYSFFVCYLLVYF
jgi:hypothetical protein